MLNEYDDKYLRTAGTKVSKIHLTVPFGPTTEVEVDLTIFDITGQRGFKDMVKETYFHGCQGLVAVSDVTRKETLAAVHDWLSVGMSVAGDVPAILFVNKMDLADRQRAMTDQDIVKVARTWEMPISFTSAKTGEGVDEAFNVLAITIVDRAFREMQARAVEQNLREKILALVMKNRGGVSKAMFFEAFRGVSYNELEGELKRLGGEGIIELNWNGPADFTVFMTTLGERIMRRE